MLMSEILILSNEIQQDAHLEDIRLTSNKTKIRNINIWHPTVGKKIKWENKSTKVERIDIRLTSHKNKKGCATSNANYRTQFEMKL